MAYKVFQNGFQLPASDLNNYLMNQSVTSWANAAARSAGIPTPVEGMFSTLDDTDLLYRYNGTSWVDVNDNTGAIQKSLLTTQGDLIVRNGTEPARLGIGSNGQVLTSNGTTATWSSPAASGGMALLSTTTLSGTSTTISGISQGYKNLLVHFDATMSASGFLTIKPNDTCYQSRFIAGATGKVENTTGALTDSTSTRSIGIMEIPIYTYSSSSGYRIAPFSNVGSGQTSFGSMATEGFAPIDNIRFGTVAGTATLSGTVRIYGVN